MSKFNKKAAPAFTRIKTKNAAGGVAYKRDERRELCNLLLNSMLANGKNSIYESEKALINRIQTAITQYHDDDVDFAKFLAKLLIFVRDRGNMRSATHLATISMIETFQNAPFLRRAINKVIFRVDDMTEMLSLWNQKHHKKNGKGKMIPNAMRRAFRDVLESRFDEYQFKKYEGGRKAVKLKDVVKLSHPDPTKREDPTIFKRIIEGKLKPINTMMTARSSGLSAADATSSLLAQNKLGVMAALKNLRDSLATGISDSDLDKLCALISNQNAIIRQHVLPMRIWSAYTSLNSLGAKVDRFKLSKVEQALDRALMLSYETLGLVEPGERVAIILDKSGSMNDQLTDSLTRYDVAKIIAGSLQSAMSKENCVVYLFGSRCYDMSKLIQPSVLNFVQSLPPANEATIVSEPFRMLTETKTRVDKIIFLSDLQVYDYGVTDYQRLNRGDLTKYFNSYKAAISPNKPVKLLFWSVAPHIGGTPIALSNNVMEVYGYSDVMFELIPHMWNDQNHLVDMIESIEL